jgi:hypothetical protein
LERLFLADKQSSIQRRQHTLAAVIPAIEQLIGHTIERSTPVPDTAATMCRPITSSKSISWANYRRLLIAFLVPEPVIH